MKRPHKFVGFTSSLLIKIYIFVLISLSLLSCKTNHQKKDRSTLTMGVEVNPTNLDPRFSLDAASSKVTQVVFNGLVKRDAGYTIVPDLAEKWEEVDSTTYIFYLKKGVTFHNGAAFTADDVKYTISSILDPSYKSPKRSGFSKINNIEIIDAYTIKFTLHEPFAPFLENMLIGIVPRSYAEKAGDSFASKPIGTGPFKFVQWIKDERIVFEANKEYFDGQPGLNVLIYRIIPDETIRLLELEKGNIDLLQNAVPPDFLPRIQKNRNLKIQRTVGTNFSYLGFNMDDSILKHKKVRQAFAYSIDRKKIIQYILKGNALPASGVISPANRFYESDVKKYPYDTKKAKLLLDEAGYTDPDGDGPLTRFTLLYKTSQNELRKLIAEVIQQQLKDVGIDLIIKNFEWGTFFADIKSGNFQTYTLTWVGISDPDIYHYIFHSDSIPPNGANRGRYRNSHLDDLLLSGRKTLDLNKRKQIYSAVQKIIAEDAPYVNLWYSENIAVMKKNIAGFVVYPDEGLYSLKDVYVEE